MPLYPPSLRLLDSSPTFIWILWTLFSPWLTGQLDGRRWLCWASSQPNLVSEHFSSPGLQDFEFLWFLRQIEDQTSGPKSAVLWVFLSWLLPAFTCRLMVWSNIFIHHSRLLSVLPWLAQFGLSTCLWCSLVSGLFPKRTLGSPSPRLCLVLLLLFPESS